MNSESGGSPGGIIYELLEFPEIALQSLWNLSVSPGTPDQSRSSGLFTPIAPTSFATCV